MELDKQTAVEAADETGQGARSLGIRLVFAIFALLILGGNVAVRAAPEMFEPAIMALPEGIFPAEKPTINTEKNFEGSNAETVADANQSESNVENHDLTDSSKAAKEPTTSAKPAQEKSESSEQTNERTASQ